MAPGPGRAAVDEIPEIHEHPTEDGERPSQRALAPRPAFSDGPAHVRHALDALPQGVGGRECDRADVRVDERAAAQQAWFERGVDTSGA